jgi:hypothetical protein
VPSGPFGHRWLSRISAAAQADCSICRKAVLEFSGRTDLLNSRGSPAGGAARNPEPFPVRIYSADADASVSRARRHSAAAAKEISGLPASMTTGACPFFRSL